MFPCVHPGDDKFEPSQRTHDHAFARSIPLVPPHPPHYLACVS